MKKILFSLLLFFVFTAIMNTITAQDIETIKADRQSFIWGEGSGSSVKSADQAALAEIIGQISTQVQSSTEAGSTETNGDLKTHWKDVVNTYSSATLNNTQKIVLQSEPDAKVFRFVKRSEVTKIFEGRKNKIIELAHNGEAALKNLQIADALRYYYWSQTLLRSHPDASDVKMKSDAGADVLLITWLPVQINQIFATLSVKIDQVEKQDNYSNYLLDIRYNKEQVHNFDYSYWDGKDWSNIVSAKDGIGVVEIPNTQLSSEIRLKAEYIFEGEAAIDMELRDVMQKLPEVPYKASYRSLGIKTTPKPVAPSSAATATTAATADAPATQSLASMGAGAAVSTKQDSIKKDLATALNTLSKLAASAQDSTQNSTQPAAVSLQAPALKTDTVSAGSLTLLTETADKEAVMRKIIAAISKKEYASTQALFTAEGYGIFQALLEYGNARILKTPERKYYQFGDHVICRSIPMSFNFKSNNRSFVESVVFYFDKDNKISNLTFSLAKKSVDDIAANNNWNEEVRMQLINFMENYQTAFALKRLDYLEKIFSDDALIITGRLVKVNPSPETKYSNNKMVKFSKQTKAEYLKKLKATFASNEFVNLRFADNTVKRAGKSNMYGIQIKQDYFSANYGDTGYLFLAIDFSDSIAPLIHVRSWQPEKNADGTVYGLSDF